MTNIIGPMLVIAGMIIVCTFLLGFAGINRKNDQSDSKDDEYN